MGSVKVSSDAFVGPDSMPTQLTDESSPKEGPPVEGHEFHRRGTCAHGLRVGPYRARIHLAVKYPVKGVK